MKFTYILTLLFLIQFSLSFHFIVDKSQKYCFVEDLMADQNVLLKFKVPTLSLNSHDGNTNSKLAIQVFDPLGNLYHNHFVETHEESYYSFASTRDLTGYFEICLKAEHLGYISHPLEVHLTLHVDEDHKEYKKIASKDHLEKMSGLIEQLRDKERAVSQELEYMKERENQFRGTSNTINGRLIWVHLMLFAVTVVVGAWQVWTMQNYFRAKKLI
jgi:hypothetical protein